MFPFIPDKLRVEHVRVKSVTCSMGGSIKIVDPSNEEKYKKIPVPKSTIRHFTIAHNNTSRFLKPVIAALVFYDDIPVALEAYPYEYDNDVMDTVSGDLVRWESESERNLSKIMEFTQTGNWFTDGVSVYKFDRNSQIMDLSLNGKFRAVPTVGFNFSFMPFRETIEPKHYKVCVQFATSDNRVITSPPLWRKISDFTLKTNADYPFENINDILAVNIAFALKSAENIVGVFGYDAISPLALEEIMIRLNSVNLPRLSNYVKFTYDIGMPFTHAFAWILGLLNNTKSLSDYINIRFLLQYLTKKGVYRKGIYTDSAIYLKDKSFSDIPLLSLEGETFIT
jgi:hypothetical protein